MSAEEQAATPVTDAADASTQVDAAPPKEEGVKVFAGNLSYKSTDEDLKALFEPLGGDILSIQIVFRGTRSSGYGFIAYKNQADADKAVSELNGTDVNGRALVVELAKPPQPKERKPRAKKAPRAPRAEDAVDGEEETAQNGEAPADGEVEAKPKRTRPPRRRGPKKDADGNPIPPAEPTAEGEEAPAPAARAPRARKPKAAPRIDDETREAIPPTPRAPRAPRAPRPPPTGEPSKTLLFVANLPFSLQDEGLNKIFTDGGVKISTARIVKRKFGIKRSKGFGFVDCVDEEEQKKALALDGTEIESRAIAVKVALNSQQDPEAKSEEKETNLAAAAAEPTTEGTTTTDA